MPKDVQDDAYGNMRPHTNFHGKYLLYRCRARSWGRLCPQKSIRAEIVEEQVIGILKNLKPPEDWRKRMVAAMGQLLGDVKLDERLKEIKTIIERMDFRWDQGFITDKDAYLEQRVKLQQELEQLNPMADDELEIAADLLEHFSKHWQATNGDRKRQQQLIQLIVARVWVRGDKVVALSLRPNFHVTVGLESTKSTEISVDYSQTGSQGEHFVHRRERRGFDTALATPFYARFSTIGHPSNDCCDVLHSQDKGLLCAIAPNEDTAQFWSSRVPSAVKHRKTQVASFGRSE